MLTSPLGKLRRAFYCKKTTQGSHFTSDAAKDRDGVIIMELGITNCLPTYAQSYLSRKHMMIEQAQIMPSQPRFSNLEQYSSAER